MKLPETFVNIYHFYYLNSTDKRAWWWGAQSDEESRFIYFRIRESNIIKFNVKDLDPHSYFIHNILLNFLKEYE